MLVEIERDNGTLYLRVPFNPRFQTELKSRFGGHWNSGAEAWVVDAGREQPVRALLVEWFGTTGDDGAPLVEVDVDLGQVYQPQRPDRLVAQVSDDALYFAGRPLATRRQRDWLVRLHGTAYVAEGRFETSGGSRANPAIGDVRGIVVRVEQVPRNHPDATRPGVTIVETETDPEVTLDTLTGRRDLLLAQLAEVDRQIAATRGTEPSGT